MLYMGTFRKVYRTVVAVMVSTLMVTAGPYSIQARERGVQRVIPSSPATKQVRSAEAYRLGGGDRIRIDNPKLPEYNGEYVIPTGGSLSLPLVGNVSLQGLTLEEATQAITAAYNRILKRPRIGVRLVEPRPLNIVVSGEVNRPGSYTVPILDTRTPGIRYPTVTQLIQQAEGVTQSADLSRVQVRRQQRSGSQQIINLNIQEFLRIGNPNQDITVRDGDTIFVPTSTNVTLAQSNYVANTSLATDATKPRTVQVLGEIANPGSYVITGGNIVPDRNVGGRPTLTRAIQLAGGITSASDLQRIQVRRSTKAGSEQIFNVNLWQFLRAGDTNQDLILQDGDTIFIPTLNNITLTQANQLATLSIATDITKPRTVAVVGEVTSPGPYVVVGGETKTEGRTIGGLPTLTRAIELAGGITQGADIRNIQVRRITKTGIQQNFTINLWQFLQEGDTNQDLIVQEGDTIFIPTLSSLNPTEARQLSSVSFGANPTNPRTVAVAGEVNRPGPYVLIGGETKTEGRTIGGLPTVTKAIQLAGGITQGADIRNIQLRRPTRGGVEQIININLWQFLQAGDLSQDLIVEDGDTIFIPTATDIDTAEVSQLASSSLSPNSIQVSVVGEVGRPGRIEVRPDTTLNQALLTAGGFNRSRAKRSAVELIRLNSNGTISRRTVPIDFNQGINEQTNPLLRNNDIIVVGRSGLARVGDTLENVVGSGGIFSVFRIFEILGIW